MLEAAGGQLLSGLEELRVRLRVSVIDGGTDDDADVQREDMQWD